MDKLNPVNSKYQDRASNGSQIIKLHHPTRAKKLSSNCYKHNGSPFLVFLYVFLIVLNSHSGKCTESLQSIVSDSEPMVSTTTTRSNSDISSSVSSSSIDSFSNSHLNHNHHNGGNSISSTVAPNVFFVRGNAREIRRFNASSFIALTASQPFTLEFKTSCAYGNLLHDVS